ncbi:hypothetical protein K525DRAFT_274117 [Schizophyllum commune Loenen D]|nr:hypothetical protein K525DRAFT_274117 [Schizophyllum commune Loenen D]
MPKAPPQTRAASPSIRVSAAMNLRRSTRKLAERERAGAAIRDDARQLTPPRRSISEEANPPTPEPGRTALVAPPLAVPLTREVSYHDEPPASILRVERPASGGMQGVSGPRSSAPSPLEPPVIRPTLDNLVTAQGGGGQPPAYEATAPQPPRYGRGERGPYDLFPFTEPRGMTPTRSVEGSLSVSRSPVAATPPPRPPSVISREVPHQPNPFPPPQPIPVPSVPIEPHRRPRVPTLGRGASPRPPSSPPLPPSQPHTARASNSEEEVPPLLDAQRLAAKHYPFLRVGESGFAPPLEARFVTLPGTHSPTARRVDGFRMSIPQCGLELAEGTGQSLVTGSCVQIRCASFGYWGEYFPLETLEVVGRHVFVLGYHVFGTSAYPVVVRVPQRFSSVLSREEIFLVFQQNMRPSLALKEIYRRARSPRRWDHLLALMRIYTIKSLLVEMGREDVLARVPEELHGWLVAPPEAQNFATNLLFGVAPSRGPLPRL